ncbi:MAG: rhodanese-like domain-containing protein [Thermoanaerobaculia bacterium]
MILLHRLLGCVAAWSLLTGAAGCLGTGTRRVDAPCREMRASVAREMLRDSREIPLLDVRALPAPRLRGAHEIPLSELRARFEEVGRFRRSPVVVVGDAGGEARQACELLAAEGFRYVIFVPEGAEGLFAGVRGADAVSDAPEERR